MSVYSSVSVLASLVSFLLGAFVYSRGPRDRVNQLFFLLCIATGYAAFMEFNYRQAESYEAAAYWIKMVFLWPFMLSFLMHLVLAFTGFLRRR